MKTSNRNYHNIVTIILCYHNSLFALCVIIPLIKPISEVERRKAFHVMLAQSLYSSYRTIRVFRCCFKLAHKTTNIDTSKHEKRNDQWKKS